MGIKFEHYPIDFIDKAFFIFILYNFINFLWLSIDTLQEWRIRLTGTRLSYVTTGRLAGSYADYPNDPRQSSLMTWWSEEAKKIESFIPLITSLEERIIQLDEHLRASNIRDQTNINSVIQANSRLTNDLSSLRRKITEVVGIISSVRIPVSLNRFEVWYKRFSYSQLARWIILEWGLPIGLSLFALYLTCPWTVQILF